MNIERYIRAGRGQSKSRHQARKLAAVAKERRLPKMHWTWIRRHRDLESLFQVRFGSTLPNNAAGLHAAKFLAQHYMRLHFDAERVTRANLRIWARWLTEKQVARIIKGAAKAKAPSAVQLGRDFRVTADEIAALGLQTIRAIEVTQEDDRNRQARRRQKAGGTGKRGRPSLGLSPAEKKTRENAQAAKRMKKKRLRENDHASSYIRETSVTEFSVTETPHVDRRAHQRDGAEHLIDDFGEDDTIELDGGCALASPPQRLSSPSPT